MCERDDTGAPHWRRSLGVGIFGCFATVVDLTTSVAFPPLHVAPSSVRGPAADGGRSDVCFAAAFLDERG